MKTGLLIYNDSTSDLQTKVQVAIRKHQAKTGVRPNVCYVHREALTNGPFTVDGVRVSSMPTVLRHHFWIGVEKK